MGNKSAVLDGNIEGRGWESEMYLIFPFVFKSVFLGGNPNSGRVSQPFCNCL